MGAVHVLCARMFSEFFTPVLGNHRNAQLGPWPGVKLQQIAWSSPVKKSVFDVCAHASSIHMHAYTFYIYAYVVKLASYLAASSGLGFCLCICLPVDV